MRCGHSYRNGWERLVKDDAAVLLVDEENKVTDISFVPDQRK
jgi:hypothetical protein